MADKKSNALAKRLIDDLLEDESQIVSEEDLPQYPHTSVHADDHTVPVSLPVEDVIQDRTEISTTDDTVKKRDMSYEAEDKVRASVGRFAGLRNSWSSADASLAQAENLRLAQSRILELESEVEKLRSNNEQLAAAGETLRQRADENMAEFENLKSRNNSIESAADDEKQILQNNLYAREKELGILRTKVDEMEMRLSTNIQKIRVRERELENRLELVKMESQALLRSKDEMLLTLKRQIDQLNLELENYRNKGQELNRQIQEKQELLRRTVKALRLALSMLEGDDESLRLKKAK